MEEKKEFQGKSKKHLLYIAIVVVLIALTFWYLKSEFEGLEFGKLLEAAKDLNPLWILLALLSMVLYPVIEGRCLAVIAKPMGYRLNYRQTTLFAAADMYFSAITPSASGGQPASAYYMVKKGMKVSESTTTLVLNILLYTLSLLAMGVWAMIWKFQFLLDCSRIFKILFAIGMLIHILLAALCIVCIFSKETVRNFGSFLLKVLYKLKFIKNREKKMESINGFVDKYGDCVTIIKENKGIMVKAFIGNCLQRMAFITAGYCVYRSFGFSDESFAGYTAIMLLLMVAVNGLPIPGAIGVSEGNFMAIFATVYTASTLMPGMIFTRFINYYILFIVCGIFTLICHLKMIKDEK